MKKILSIFLIIGFIAAMIPNVFAANPWGPVNTFEKGSATVYSGSCKVRYVKLTYTGTKAWACWYDLASAPVNEDDKLPFCDLTVNSTVTVAERRFGEPGLPVTNGIYVLVSETANAICTETEHSL